MCFATSAQTINQKGVTYRYNGKNKRTPIGGVYIKTVTANNGVVSDESNGTFTLVLNSLQMGSIIRKTIFSPSLKRNDCYLHPKRQNETNIICLKTIKRNGPNFGKHTIQNNR